MTWTFFIITATVLVAFANGANDNFKGVATLFGSATTNYRKALVWATATTFTGSVAAFFLAQKLVSTFSGKGLVPSGLVEDPTFLTAVVQGAGLTVLVAARFGIPISTTHSLTGALVGAGVAAVGPVLHWNVLARSFLLPLIVGPFIAVTLTMSVYPALRWLRRRLDVRRTTCVCIGEKVIPVGKIGLANGAMLSAHELRSYDIFVDEKQACQARAVETYDGHVLGFQVKILMDRLHFLSAGAVSFARGLNDTPKIVAISMAAGAIGLQWNIGLVAVAMALGGILAARRVAETMSHKITSMNHGQGCTANLVTAFLVIIASRLGMPVSTTHVSCGSIFGIGLANGRADKLVIGEILLAWVLTVPVGALCAAVCFFVLNLPG